MGVMACRRTGCENILCNRYSSKYGYICEDCFQEMINSKLDIFTFMMSSKVNNKNYDYHGEFK